MHLLILLVIIVDFLHFLWYDAIFKKLFNPEIYPERLSDLISSIISIPVTVIRALPLQESILEGNALLIMDILVQLEDGSLANVEVQKIPYMFPAERMSCYSSDLVLRQYSRVKGEKGKAFTYTVYPWLEAIYQDMASYLHKPEEVLTMFSDALKILDHNTVQYMIDEMQNTIDDQKAQLSDKDSQLADKDSQLADKDSQLTDMHSQLADKDSQIAALKAQLLSQQK